MRRDSERMRQLMDELAEHPLEDTFLSVVIASAMRRLVGLAGFSTETLSRAASVEEEELFLLLHGSLDNDRALRITKEITPYLKEWMLSLIESIMRREVERLKR